VDASGSSYISAPQTASRERNEEVSNFFVTCHEHATRKLTSCRIYRRVASILRGSYDVTDLLPGSYEEIAPVEFSLDELYCMPVSDVINCSLLSRSDRTSSESGKS